ncbi:AcvB/VirJ family lysyl-phosphatidylglycerol hydrolase [Salinisphaera sp. SWV1]
MRSDRSHWHKPHVLLIGYSRGGDVMAFRANGLPADGLNAVVCAGMSGFGAEAQFEFHFFIPAGRSPVWGGVQTAGCGRRRLIVGAAASRRIEVHFTVLTAAPRQADQIGGESRGIPHPNRRADDE